MALSELLAALESETEARAAAELRRAEEEAERLRQAATAEGSARVEALLAEHARTLRARSEQRLVAARRKAEARVLEARRDLLDRVFDGAVGLQDEVRGWETYPGALERDVRTLLALAAGEEVTLVCAPQDRARVAAAAGVGARVEPSPEVAAGLLLRSADGRVEMNRTLAARLAASRADLAIRVVRRVEAGG